MGARELLSDLVIAGLSIKADGNSLVIRPASKLTDTMRSALREAKPELLALLRDVARTLDLPGSAAVAWTDAEIARFTERRARLMRWGWPEAEAEKLADRLLRRDREPDDRVSCIDCTHYWPSRCGNHGHAGLQAPDVGRDLASLLQRCPGFQSVRQQHGDDEHGDDRRARRHDARTRGTRK